MLSAMSETVVDDPAAGFAALMNKAAEAAGGAEEAPYGYTRDEATGEMRPKKAQGRPRRPPALDELKAQKAGESATDVADKPGDRAPDAKRRPHRRTRPEDPGKPKPPVPQFREGVIERGINQLYRKAGKLVRVMDPDVGQALIDITRKEDDDDVTVGAAWEQIARTNPRIRAFLMKIISGGAWGQLFMCHAPVLMAVLMKEQIRKRIPFVKVAEAFLTPDEDGEAPADGTAAGGLTVPDMNEMMAMAQAFAAQAMNGRAPAPGPRAPVAPDGSPVNPSPPGT